MITRYEILTTVFFKHSYFVPANYTGFTVEPDADTQYFFRRLSVFYKPLSTRDGFQIIFETDDISKRTREEILNESVTLGFYIRNTDPDFISYTDGITENIADTVLYFRNTVKDISAASSPGLMHENDFFSVKDILHNSRQPKPDAEHPAAEDVYYKQFFTKPFGWLEINLHKGLEENLVVNFKGRETIWRYILNSDHLSQLELVEPAVIHKDRTELFRKTVVVLPDGNERVAFESTKPIALSNKARKTFLLVDEYDDASGKYKRLVYDMLPNPNIKLISKIISKEKQEEKIFSEILI